ncbi:MAG: acetyl-CoA carboxylase biotin carboxyl carrier protein subunit [Chloroflexota bacterium]|nr:MAG: acetyl-CoA carboxylase biotin carboxyl carrier protein subunit [Chloroflexota bacterium]
MAAMSTSETTRDQGADANDGRATPVEGAGRIPDPRGVRVSLVHAAAGAEIAALVLEPPQIPVAPSPRIAGRGVLGGTGPIPPATPPDPDDHRHVLVDGQPAEAELIVLDGVRAILARGGPAGTRDQVLIMPPAPPSGAAAGLVRREVVVGGWRVELEIEPAARAALRERARRGREEVGHAGPTEVHAIIPGVVVSVSVAAGDPVAAGQQLLVVEAMKMQNELRAPRDGTIERVAVAAGRTIEVGDLLLVIS